jgi:hypothetical protein
MHVIRIERTEGKWLRWVVVQDPESSARRFWSGRRWVRSRRYARLYCQLRSAFKDLKRLCEVPSENPAS